MSEWCSWSPHPKSQPQPSLSRKVGRSLGDMGVVGGKLLVHTDEQEDGVEMPDLNLSISSVSSHS